jgi:hypothetical protein
VEGCIGRNQTEPSDLNRKNPIAVGSVRSYPRVKPLVNRGEGPKIDLDRPNDEDHVS